MADGSIPLAALVEQVRTGGLLLATAAALQAILLGGIDVSGSTVLPNLLYAGS